MKTYNDIIESATRLADEVSIKKRTIDETEVSVSGMRDEVALMYDALSGLPSAEEVAGAVEAADRAEAAAVRAENQATRTVKDAAEFFSLRHLEVGRYSSQDGLAWDVLLEGSGHFTHQSGREVSVVPVNGECDIKSFGATGNDTVDDEAFHRAASYGGNVFISAGRYKFTGTTPISRIANGCTWRGLKDQSKISITSPTGSFIYQEGGDNISFNGLHITGSALRTNTSTSCGIMISNARGVVYDNNIISNFNVNIWNGSCDGIRLAGNHLNHAIYRTDTGTSGYGFLSNQGGRNIIASGNFFEENERHHFYCSNTLSGIECSGIVLTNNFMKSSNIVNASVKVQGECIIDGNVIHQKGGLMVMNTSHNAGPNYVSKGRVTISNNTITANAAPGTIGNSITRIFDFEYAENVTIRGNRISLDGDTGIRCVILIENPVSATMYRSVVFEDNEVWSNGSGQFNYMLDARATDKSEFYVNGNRLSGFIRLISLSSFDGVTPNSALIEWGGNDMRISETFWLNFKDVDFGTALIRRIPFTNTGGTSRESTPANNRSFVTKVSGTNYILASSTTRNIQSKLYNTTNGPLVQLRPDHIRLIPLEDADTITKMWVTVTNNNQFVVNVDVAPTRVVNFAWSIDIFD